MNPLDPSTNPYAAPQPAAPQAAPYVYGHAPSPAFYTYREGKALVHPLNTWLPAVCMKCARPDGLISRDHKFQYTPPWTILVFLFCNLAGVIAMLVARKQARMPVPLCASCNARWRRATIVLWSLMGTCFGAFVLAMVLMTVSESVAGALFILAGLTLIAFFVAAFAVIQPAQLRAQRIDPAHVWILGVHPDVLNQMPSPWVDQRR